MKYRAVIFDLFGTLVDELYSKISFKHPFCISIAGLHIINGRMLVRVEDSLSQRNQCFATQKAHGLELLLV